MVIGKSSWNPDFSNLQGKRKSVQKIGGSSKNRRQHRITSQRCFNQNTTTVQQSILVCQWTVRFVIYFLVSIKTFRDIGIPLKPHFCKNCKQLRSLTTDFMQRVDFKLAYMKRESPEAYLLKLEKNKSQGFAVNQFCEKCGFKYVPISRTFLYLQENK